MKIKLTLIAAVFILALSSCKKDLATAWIGLITAAPRVVIM